MIVVSSFSVLNAINNHVYSLYKFDAYTVTSVQYHDVNSRPKP